MQHPNHYTGIKSKVGFFLLQHSLLTAKQWREVMLSDMEDMREIPHSDEEFRRVYHMSERQLKMTRQQLEETITRSPTWRNSFPTLQAYTSAFALACVGEIGGPESSLGPTREIAMQLLRRRLGRLEMVSIEVALDHYDASGSHPKHVFGPGWTEEDQRKRHLRAAEQDRESGFPTEDEWLAERHTHLHLRLFDRFLYWKQLSFVVSLPRRYRELRYRSPGLMA